MTWSVANYNTNPALNTSINGTDISEGSAAAGYNDALRQIMADIAAWTAAYAVTYPIAINKGGTGATTATAAFNALAANGGTMGGSLTFSGDGVFVHHAASAMTGGKIYFQPSGSDPTSAKGDMVFEW